MLILGLVLALLAGLLSISGQAATQQEITDAIDAGVLWLVGEQNPDGSWGSWAQVARTGLAVVKLEDRAIELGYDSPFDPEYVYSGNVSAGLDYIFSQAGNETCGIHFSQFDHPTYNTGIAMMAIANSGNISRVVNVAGSIVNGWTYEEVLTANVDWFVNTQTPNGAWGYGDCPPGTWADNSNSGYATLGLRYAEAAGVAIPQGLKDNLEAWTVFIQNAVNGDANDGGSGYTGPDEWVNMLKTGNLLFQMAFVGNTTGVQDAIDYIERHWEDNNDDPGWRPHHYQSMYAMMKGLESLGIETIDVYGNGTLTDWYEEFADVIVASQNADGSWPSDNWGDSMLSTVWALHTLEKVAPPVREIDVAVDVKPTSCRNPLNVKEKGVIPVAILGTDALDVSQIDPATVKLGNVAPLRWAMEDVATPFEPYTGKVDAFDCTIEGPDGFMDLTFKFKAQEVIADLGEVNDGDVLVLHLTGTLLEEFGGTPIVGEDVVVILKKGK